MGTRLEIKNTSSVHTIETCICSFGIPIARILIGTPSPSGSYPRNHGCNRRHCWLLFGAPSQRVPRNLRVREEGSPNPNLDQVFFFL